MQPRQCHIMWMKCVGVWWVGVWLVMTLGSLTLSILTAPAIWGHNCEGSLWLDY